jgi:hypothetical protein
MARRLVAGAVREAEASARRAGRSMVGADLCAVAIAARPTARNETPADSLAATASRFERRRSAAAVASPLVLRIHLLHRLTPAI